MRLSDSRLLLFRTKIFVVLLLGFCVSQMSYAQTANADLKVDLSIFKVTAKSDGKEELTPANRLSPGDTVEYVAVYRNQGKAAARNVLATLPVPDSGLTYIPNSASPSTFEASADGNSYAVPPLMRNQAMPDGKNRKVEVPLNEYRYLRWQLGDIAPGKSKAVKARMQL